MVDLRHRTLSWVALGVVAACIGAGCSNASAPAGSSTSSNAPGVSAHQVDVGAVATLSGDVAADFAPIVPGVRAYLDMVNAAGGVDGRKIVLTKALDDGTLNNAQVTRTIVEQDHVFAIVGEATAFFTGAPFLVQTGTPTFGFATQNDWAGAKNLFAAYGSVVRYSSTEPFFGFVAKKVHAHVAAVVSYGVPQSAAECQHAVAALQEYGVPVGYADLAVPVGSSLSSDVVHMKQAGVDFVVSCLDLPGNLQLSRGMQQNGLAGTHQLWLDGYDLSTLRRYPSLMQHTYFLVQHVPFQVAAQFPGKFPGMERYIAIMNKYEPAYTFNEVAMEGWISAALFVAGLRAAGPELTQKKLVDAINKISKFQADDLTNPVNWKVDHTGLTPPSCETFVEAQGDTFKVVFNHGSHIWVCFPLTGRADLDHPVPPPPGAPGT